MSINKEYDLMKTSFLEAKDIINQIFRYFSAPKNYFIKHMTFDELVVALYRLFGIFKNKYGDNPPHIEYIVDTFDGTATGDDILLNKVAYSKGQRIVGNIVSFPSHTYMPTTTDIIIPEKHYLEEDQIIKGDPNLIPENIKPGVTIFEVENPISNIIHEDIILDEENPEQIIQEGWHDNGSVRIQLEERTVMPNQEQQLVEPQDNHVLSRVIVEGDEDLVSENIKKDTTIFGVSGNDYVVDTQDGDALSSEIVDGKTAYVQGEKIIGTMPKYNIGDIILDEENPEQEIEEGYHEPANIRIQTQEKYAHPSIHELIIEPDDDHVLSRVFVDGDEDLIPKNIRKDVIIFDVVGELEEFNKYNILYVINVLKQTAYQQQVEYNEQFSIISTQPVLDDYEFKGWSPDPNAETVVYQPGQLVTTNLADKGGAYILYAVLEEMNLADITLDITYQNGGKLSSGQEIATVVVHGGNLSTGYSNVQKDVQCDNAIFISKFANETQNSYDNQLKFTEIGFYPVIVVHKRKDKQVQATGVIKVAGENGGMNGEGTMTFESNPTVSYFDSGWISTDIIKGCWIKGYTYNYQSGDGHSSQSDELAVFGKTSSGKMILLYDFGNTANLKKEININSITGADIYNDGTYRLSVGDFELTNNNLSVTQWTITDSFTKNDDIRQLRFFASSNHGVNCFNLAHIDYDIQYEFDMDLWEEDKGRTNSHNHSYSYQITTPATCGTEGLKTGTCSCGQTVTEPIPATGKHTWDNGTVTTQATCASNGVKTITCTVCGQTKTENIAATGNHSWNAGVVTKEPTVNATGVKTYTCNVCGKTKTEVIPKLEPELQNNLDTWSHFNTKQIIDEVGYKWGYYSLNQGAISGYDKNKLITAYLRIRNACKDNGVKEKYAVIKYDTKESTNPVIITKNARINGLDSKALCIYLEDLNLPFEIIQRVHHYVFMDNPELMMMWSSYYPQLIDGCYCFFQFPESTRQNYLNKINTTFKHICNQIKTTYGITYTEDTFTNNYKRYNATQKKKIGKVIHDYIVNHSNYSFRNEGDGLNQTAYPALSEGIADPVCASYAQAFVFCCQKWGIMSTVILGLGDAQDVNAYHEWAMVNYTSNNYSDNNIWNVNLQENQWQDIDVTWDDPVWNSSYTNVYPNYIGWRYFNKTTSFFRDNNHIRKYNDGNGVYLNYPTSNCTCTANTYNYSSTNEGGIAYGGF